MPKPLVALCCHCCDNRHETEVCPYREAGLPKITLRQRRVLDCIHRSLQEYGYPPTLREIGRSLCIGSTNGVTDHLRALQRKGYLKENRLQRSRSWVPVPVNKLPQVAERPSSQARGEMLWWHPYASDKPPKDGHYLLCGEGVDGERLVLQMEWREGEWENPSIFQKVRSWAYMPYGPGYQRDGEPGHE